MKQKLITWRCMNKSCKSKLRLSEKEDKKTVDMWCKECQSKMRRIKR